MIDPKDKWVCQVEVKFQVPTRAALDYDFWRVSEYKYIQSFLEGKSTIDKQLKDFKKYGLFIAGGAKDLYQMWQTPEAWLQGWFDVTDKSGKSIVQKSTYPNELKDKKFGLAYYLINVTEDNDEEHLSNF